MATLRIGWARKARFHLLCLRLPPVIEVSKACGHSFLSDVSGLSGGMESTWRTTAQVREFAESKKYKSHE